MDVIHESLKNAMLFNVNLLWDHVAAGNLDKAQIVKESLDKCISNIIEDNDRLYELTKKD